ncbi:hypothetical protein D2T81_21635 [Azospirillum brasilense]|nr:hypothetical protein D2T81_21635 [Azospirillum brasilense]
MGTRPVRGRFPDAQSIKDLSSIGRSLNNGVGVCSANDGVRVEITDARLQYMPTRRDGKDFAPRIMADELAGRVTPAA